MNPTRIYLQTLAPQKSSPAWESTNGIPPKKQTPSSLEKPNSLTTPLLKWPGGKRALLKHILPLLPMTYGRYYEPFLGGAALFFGLQPRNAFLSDSNPELINCYLQVRDHPDELILSLKRLKNSKKDYYHIRDQTPRIPISRAARFVYLTALSFNGIYRLNLKGKFNVPYGYKTYLQPCDRTKIHVISKALSTAVLSSMDFEEAVKDSRAEDLIYFDPPYTVAHENNGFLKYNDKIFSWADQLRLAALSKALLSRGCHVVVTNADNPSIRNLYNGFHVKTIRRASVIAASDKFRRQITECVFYKGA
jgi:DNA adenine methylase